VVQALNLGGWETMRGMYAKHKPDSQREMPIRSVRRHPDVTCGSIADHTDSRGRSFAVHGAMRLATHGMRCTHGDALPKNGCAAARNSSRGLSLSPIKWRLCGWPGDGVRGLWELGAGAHLPGGLGLRK
jgi:hypothetical protein